MIQGLRFKFWGAAFRGEGLGFQGKGFRIFSYLEAFGS
jgi:hypothetical protein